MSETENACTLAPDNIGAVSFRAACEAHDRAYREGAGMADRMLADERFLSDLLALCGERRLQRKVAYIYWTAVRLFGWKFFYFKRKT